MLENKTPVSNPKPTQLQHELTTNFAPRFEVGNLVDKNSSPTHQCLLYCSYNGFVWRKEVIREY
jgi:hypothetical protein